MDVPVPKVPADAEVEAIATRKFRFAAALDVLIATYRAFGKTPRAKLKPMLKELYGRMTDLGETVGVSRLSLAALWEG